jgi:hypothetical protein
MKEQLEGESAKVMGKPQFSGASRGDVATFQGLKQNWSYTLVSDDKTEAALSNKTPPSYRVVTINDRGEHNVLPQRFVFDPTAPVAAAEAAFMTERGRQDKLRRTQWGPLG